MVGWELGRGTSPYFVYFVIGTPQVSTPTPVSPSFLGSPVLLIDLFVHQELQPHLFLVKPCFLGLAGDGSLQGCVQPGLVGSLASLKDTLTMNLEVPGDAFDLLPPAATLLPHTFCSQILSSQFWSLERGPVLMGAGWRQRETESERQRETEPTPHPSATHFTAAPTEILQCAHPHGLSVAFWSCVPAPPSAQNTLARLGARSLLPSPSRFLFSCSESPPHPTPTSRTTFP